MAVDAKPNAKKWYVETRAALGMGAWVLALGAEQLIGTGVALACIVVGVVLFLLAAASSKAVQRQVPAIGRAPLVHDHGFRTLAPNEAPQSNSEAAQATSSAVPSPALVSPYAEARKLEDDFRRKQLPISVAQITEELEQGQHVLTGGDAEEFFVRHGLADRKWKEHGARLVELPHLHKRVRTAYIAIDALNNRGIRRDVVLSDGRPTTIIDGTRRREAREAIAAAIGALDEYTSTGRDIAPAVVITPDVRAVLLRLAANGRSVYGQASALHSRHVAESMVGDWTDEAADALHRISAELAEGFLRTAKGNGPAAMEARIKFIEDRAERVDPDLSTG